MKQQVALILSFAVSYVTSDGFESHWDFTAKLFPTGTMRVYDPAFKARDCEKRNYFIGKVDTTLTNKGNRYFNLVSIVHEFVNIGIRECFFPFRQLHFHYKDPYIPQVVLRVKMDEGLYERPIQIKADYDGKWMTADSVNKHLVVDARYTKRCLSDE